MPMHQYPFRSCDYCGAKHRDRYPWTLHHVTRKLSCAPCTPKGRREDKQAADLIARHRELLALRLLAEPSAAYGLAVQRQYCRIKVKHPGVVLLFRDGDFFIALGADALALERELGMALVQVPVGEEALPLARFPFHALDTYLPALVKAGHRVAIADRPQEGAAMVAEPFDAPLPRTHRIRLRGCAEELDVSLEGGRFYGLDGTWDIPATDRTIQRVQRITAQPALYGNEHDPFASCPLSVAGCQAPAA